MDCLMRSVNNFKTAFLNPPLKKGGMGGFFERGNLSDVIARIRIRSDLFLRRFGGGLRWGPRDGVVLAAAILTFPRGGGRKSEFAAASADVQRALRDNSFLSV